MNNSRCPLCGKVFKYKIYMTTHYKRIHKKQKVQVGGKLVLRQQTPCLGRDEGIRPIRTAHDKTLADYCIENREKHVRIIEFMESHRIHIKEILKDELSQKKTIKINFSMNIILNFPSGDVKSHSICTSAIPVFIGIEEDDIITQLFNTIITEYETLEICGSGWSLDSIESLLISCSLYTVFKGSSYLKLPPKIARKHAIINPQNDDNMCFKWAVLASQYEGPHAERISNLRPYENKFNWSGLKYPVEWHDIKTFELHNPNVSINVYALDGDKDERIFPLKVVNIEKKIHLDLLLIQHKDNFHYTYIKSFSRLFASVTNSSKRSLYYCKRCFVHFYDEECLSNHKDECKRNPAARIIMPKTRKYYSKQEKELILEEPEVKFKNPERGMDVPFVIYGDFVSVIEPGSINDREASWTDKCQSHKPMSYCLYVVTRLDPEKIPDSIPLKPILYRGEKADEHFILRIEEIAKIIYDFNKKEEPLILSRDQEILFNNSTNCYLCKKLFSGKDKVRDHDHSTGEYRGALCNNCNLQAQRPSFVPVMFHNLSNYDAHFIIKKLGITGGKIHVIPSTQETFISFSKKKKNMVELRFIDTFRFLNSSLSSLVKYLAKGKFINVTKFYPEPEKYELFVGKGVYSYHYVIDISRMETTRELPPIEDFHSKLNEANLNQSDYDHAKKVWETFKCKNLGEYSDICIRVDVLLLADVFETFRNMCLDAYKLDPAHYFSTPGIAWDALLKMTNIKLSLIKDQEMLLMFENGIRGGIAQCVQRYSNVSEVSNNSIENNTVNKNHILYLDANNLYGWAMSQKLPTGDFEWIDPNCITDILSLDPNGDKGYLFEVDLHYPKDLHDKHNDFPLCAEMIIPTDGTIRKLLTTFHDKNKYIIHITALQQALIYGLVVKNVHRIIKFSQSAWLKPYIDLNTEFRQKATNDFERDFRKLMNNSVFGKSMENIRKRRVMKFVTSYQDLQKEISKPLFKSRKIYNDTLIGIDLYKKRIYMNKPIYVGQAILDLSKVWMYKFHYEIMVPKYNHQINILYMDTDSFIYEINTVDIFDDLYELRDHFDFSGYPTDHKCFSLVNKNVVGKFKDETKSLRITQFVGLKAKLYAFQCEGKDIKKVKGIKKYATNRKLTFEDFVSCLFKDEKKYVDFHTTRSVNHNIHTVRQNKLALSPLDDKRHILPDSIHSLAHGHYKITDTQAVSRDREEKICLLSE